VLQQGGDARNAREGIRSSFEPLCDPRWFENVSVEMVTIVWPDDGLDMAPEPLYQQVRKPTNPQTRKPAQWQALQ
jgi:hypothetical protein